MKISMIPNNQVKLIHASKGDTSLRKWSFEPYDNNGAISVSDIKDQLVYKTENGGTEQLLPVNTSTPATSYFDGTINYGTDTDVEFTYKQSSYTGQARIKSIKGNTLVWNQILEPLSTTYYAVSRCTTSYTDGNGVFTATEQTTNYSFGVYHKNGGVYAKNPIENHKYFMSAEVSVNFDATLKLGFDVGGYSPIEKNKKIRVYSVKTATSSTTAFVCYATKQNTYPTTSDVMTVDNWWICDLTQAYGEGNEPTADEFVSLFSLPMYAFGQYLLNFNGTGIKTVGKNLLNPNDAGQVYATVTYSDDVYEIKYTGSGNRHVAMNFYRQGIPNFVFPSDGKYRVSFTIEGTDTTWQAGLRNVSNSNFDANNSVSIYEDGHYSFTIDFSSVKMSDYYFSITRAGNLTSAVTVLVKNLQIELGETESSYEPYTTSTTSLPVSTYFPTGMKSAGIGTSKVYDELSDKAVTRVAQADLGSLNWNTTSDTNRFTSADTKNIAKPAPLNTEVANMTSTVRCTSYADLTNKTGEGVALNSNETNYGMVCIRDTSVSSVEDLVTKYTGVYLNYELITYTEQDIKNASLVCKNIEVPCYLSSGNLVCDATEELTNESGFFDAKLKLKDSSSVAYSSKFKLHVEGL